MSGRSGASRGVRWGRVAAVVIVASLGFALAALVVVRTEPIPVAVRAEVMVGAGAGNGPEDDASANSVKRCFHAREGGQLALPAHGGVLHVPVGALEQDSCIRLIAERADRRGFPSQFTIEPEDIVFDPPAVFELDFAPFSCAGAVVGTEPVPRRARRGQ